MTTALKNAPATDNNATRRPNAIGKILGPLLVIVAAVVLLGVTTHTSDSSTETFRPGISAIDLHSEGGPITLRATDAEVITVTVHREGRLGSAPDTTSDVDGGSLRLDARCDEGLPVVAECSAAYVVDVPDGVAVSARTLAGPLDADALTGGLTAETSAGQITLRDVSGDLVLATAAGSIDATVSSDRVRATSAAGSITLANATVPSELIARTEAGSIDLVVPRSRYRVDATSSVGRVTVDVPTAADSTNGISAHSTVGSIQLSTLDSD